MTIFERTSLRARRRLIERSLWTLAAIVVGARFFYIAVDQSFQKALGTSYSELLSVLLLVVFPMVYDLTFGRLPFEDLRRRRLEARMRPEFPSVQAATLAEARAAVEVPQRSPSSRALVNLRSHTIASRRIADSLYTRSGVYLFIGALIAFIGLAFFYTQTTIERGVKSTTATSGASAKEEPATTALMLRLAELLPRFGILFFVELIAFFFLRQYRSALDEFRYFEALKRQREELLALIYLLQDDSLRANVSQLVTEGHYFSSAGKLAAGETTEILESEKLTKDELALFERIIDAIGAAKK